MPELAEVGFDRPKTAPLPGTVNFYQRHLFVCTGRAEWPGQIAEGGGFVGALAEAIATHAGAMPLQVKLNTCDCAPTERGRYDILVYPDGIRYMGLAEDDIPTLVAGRLVGDHAPAALRHEPLAGQHLFVCVHQNRDPRCGFCGPVLARLFEQEVAARGLGDRVFVHRTSHVGGHEYAGNVLVYPGGDWYGYVTPADVPRIIEQHVLAGQIVVDRWRGRMGLTRAEQVQQAKAWRS